VCLGEVMGVGKEGPTLRWQESYEISRVSLINGRKSKHWSSKTRISALLTVVDCHTRESCMFMQLRLKLLWVDLNKISNNRLTLMFHNKLNHNIYRDDFISWRVNIALFTWRMIGKAPSSTATQRHRRKSDELME
jgi:hypothetical protein